MFALIFLYIFDITHVYGAEGISDLQTKLLLKLSTNLISVTSGNKTSFITSVKNIDAKTIESVKIYIQGISPNWLEIIPKSTNITAGGTQDYLVSVNIPAETETNVYEFTATAIDELKSNSENLTLVVGKDLKEVSELLTKRFEDTESLVEKSFLVENCLDITVMKITNEDAKYAYQRSLEEYEKENYTKAIDYIEYAIPLGNDITYSIDKSLQMEIDTFKKSKIIVPPFYNSEELLIQVQKYMEEKKYDEICKPIEKMRKYVMVGIVFWLAILIIIMFLIVISLIFYRRKRVKERTDVIERIRERLGKPELKI